jgi:hypothetical protein
MMSNWYIGRNKQKFGPFSTTQIQQLITLGLVAATEYVLEEGATRWVAAGSVAGLAPAPVREHKYWLHLGGKNQGPYPAEQIQVGLMRRQLAGETLACAEGGTEWTPLAQMAEFRACVSTVAAVSRSSHAQLGLGSSHVDLSEEEAELYLAGKQGDAIARLISTLLDMRKRSENSPYMVEIIDKNVQSLKAIRSGRGFSESGPL